MSDTHIQNPILHSSQEILNESFNNTYKIIENALYLYQASTNTFVPATADASGNLQVSGGTGGGSGGLTDTQLRATPVPVSTTTDPNSIQNTELVNSLRAILQAISVPSWFDPTTNTLRVGTTAVTILSGTVTSVGSVTSLTNFGTNPADTMARDISIDAWANNCRRLIS